MFFNNKYKYAILSVGVLIASSYASANYKVIKLEGQGSGYSDIAALALNDNGNVVGYLDFVGPGHSEYQVPYIYENGQVKNLIPTTFYGAATGINASGQVSVYSGKQGYVYSNGSLVNVGTLFANPSQAAIYGNTNPKAINALGQVVGLSSVDGAHDHAFFYDGAIHDLGVLPGGDISRANGINDSAQIVGGSTTSPGAGMHAFLYDNGVMQDLGTLDNSVFSEANSINNGGIITGVSTIAGDMTQHAFLYDGVMHDLGSLASGFNSFGLDINDSNQVVGYSYAADGAQHAFLYTNGSMIDLNSLLDSSGVGWTLISATAINNSDQIIGRGIYNGAYSTFLLTPSVPLPGAGVFMASALIAMSVGARRKFK